MKTNTVLVWIVIIVAIVVIAFASGIFGGSSAPSTETPATSTPVTTASNAMPIFDKSISDGRITVGYPSADFGLATNSTQVLVKSYIPPCDSGFTYCIYDLGTAYQGTNFDSAGISIRKRADLPNETACVTVPPEGQSAKPTPLKSTATYSSSVFGNVGDAGAGHYANGSIYRLYVKNTTSCYEFQTRIGQTQYANYEPGTIREFTVSDVAHVRGELDAVIASIALSPSDTNLFASQ